MAVSDETWAEVRRAYIESDETVLALAARLGVSDRIVYKRARREGWPSRAARLGRPVGVRGPVSPVAPGHATRAAREALIRRLYRTIDRKLLKVEKRMKSGAPASPADEERETRTLETVVKSFEKVSGVETGLGRARKPDPRDGKGPTPDAERMRREIAERLEKLNRERSARRGPRDTR